MNKLKKFLQSWFFTILCLLVSHVWTYRVANNRGFHEGIDTAISYLQKERDKSKPVKKPLKLYFINQ